MVLQIGSLGFGKQSVRVVLLAGAVAGLSAFGGCEDSVTGQASKTAMVNSEKAARIAASAGDARPSEKLIEGLKSPLDPAPAKALEAQAKKDPDYKALLDIHKVGDDLSWAQKLLDDAKRNLGTADQTKAVVEPHRARAVLEAQIAYNKTLQAHELLSAMENKLEALERIAGGLQASCLDVASLGKEIEVRQAARDAGMDKIAKDLGDAQATLEKSTHDANEKDQLVKSLESQIDTLRQTAGAKHLKAQADMQAASLMRGQASIDAFDVAVKLRGEADQLSAELANKLPELAAQQSDAALAAVKVHEASERVKTIQATKETATAFQKATDAQIDSLKKQINQIVNEGVQITAVVSDPQAAVAATQKSEPGATLLQNVSNAMAEQYKQYVTLRDAIDAQSTQVGKLAGEAHTAFDNAAKARTAYVSWLKTNDPKEEQLIKVANDRDIQALLQIQKACASFDAAEAQIIGLRAALLEKGLSPNLDAALKAAGTTSAQAADIDKKIESYRVAAYQELHEHATADIAAADGLTGSTKTQAPKWLALNIKAAVLQASAQVAPDTQKAELDKAAADAVRDAQALNPSLPFPGIAPSAGGS